MDSSGAIILGGAHGSLALARSLGALKVPVAFVGHDHFLPAWSSFVADPMDWKGPDDPGAVAFLLKTAKWRGWEGRLLVAGGDGEVRFVSENRAALSAAFRIVLPEWEALRHVCDKPLLYRRAAELGIGFPRTYGIGSADEIETLDISFPVVLKPNMGGGRNRFSKAKVVRADDRPALTRAYRDAAGQVGGRNVVVQELIPGGGESQFSYCALWLDGAPLGEFTARRTRQYPVDFGYTSTFVEIADQPVLLDIARRLLASIGYSGLVEVEFKLDRRDGSFRLLDVNPRPWSWFGLCKAAGNDFGAMLWDVANGRPVEPPPPAKPAAWAYVARDACAALHLIARGELKAGAYLRSFGTASAWGAYAPDDFFPGVVDLPLTAWRVLTRRVLARNR